MVTLHHDKNAIINLIDNIQSNTPDPKLYTAVTIDWFKEFGNNLLSLLRENRKTAYISDEIEGHWLISGIDHYSFGFYNVKINIDGVTKILENTYTNPATIFCFRWVQY